ncbi:astacin [Teladorsagia circumcincta]|uniref:Astacin n=1 Tax=Teladorsagia circumcincta TaxID=45464 RepID=A0A2G9V2B1_TELCI|nr:astacin [Teladorsagia circumcincta]
MQDFREATRKGREAMKDEFNLTSEEQEELKANLQIGTAAHELGHALGFLHTHAEYDRNKFITVNKKYVNPSGCGEVLKADKNWTTLEGDHNMTYGYQDGYKKCHYWITVKIVNLPANVSDYGCKYAGVEIKTNTDQRLTGYRFCSEDDINTTLVSNSSTVPVILYMRRRRNHTGTVLHYRYVDENSDVQADQ